jgi:hypothetical protein
MTLQGTAEDTSKVYQANQIKSTSEHNTIQLLAKDAIPGINGIKHLYFVYTDDKGKQTFLSGYPESVTPPWKNIKMETGQYKAGSPDYLPSIKLVTYRSSTNNPQEVATNFKLLKAEVEKIQAAKIPYNPKGPNSNSVIMQALSRTSQVSKIETPNVNGVLSVGNEEFMLPGMYTAVTKPKAITTPQNPQVTAAERETANALKKYKNTPNPQNLVNYYQSYARTEKVKLQNGIRETGIGIQNTVDGINRAIDNPVKSYRETINQNPVTVKPTSTDNQEVASSNLNSAQPSTQIATIPSSTALIGTVSGGDIALDNTQTARTSTSTALTGTVASSTALTGTTGRTRGESTTALTGGTSTTALTGGISTTALTGGKSQESNQQQMALS